MHSTVVVVTSPDKITTRNVLAASVGNRITYSNGSLSYRSNREDDNSSCGGTCGRYLNDCF